MKPLLIATGVKDDYGNPIYRLANGSLVDYNAKPLTQLANGNIVNENGEVLKSYQVPGSKKVIILRILYLKRFHFLGLISSYICWRLRIV